VIGATPLGAPGTSTLSLSLLSAYPDVRCARPRGCASERVCAAARAAACARRCATRGALCALC
jgi:hypothetical protein